jgi:hypothetical protein
MIGIQLVSARTELNSASCEKRRERSAKVVDLMLVQEAGDLSP